MCNDETTSFSKLVCSSPSVQAAFESHRPARFWWRLILLLHGKPVRSSLSRLERIERVADGFKFCAWLYRFLAVVFFLLPPAFLALHIADNNFASFYWAGASLLAAIYLWGVSGLGYVGAKSYRTDPEQGTISLVAFMVMIIAFLSLFIAAVSVVVHHSSWLATLPNLIGVSTLFVFGIGSYMIEIIYLATERYSSEPVRPVQ